MSLRDELVIWMSSTAMKAPSITLITAIQSRRVGSPTGRSSWSPAIRLVFDVHFDGDGHAGADLALQRVIRGKREFHRNPLYDFGEVAGGIVRRQQAELRPGGGEQAVDPRLDRRIAISVERQLGLLPWLHMADLGFLEVGLNPDVLVGDDRQQVGAGLHVLAIARGALADEAADGR